MITSRGRLTTLMRWETELGAARLRLVKSKKRGRVRTYEIAPERFKVVEDWLTARRKLWEARLNELDPHWRGGWTPAIADRLGTNPDAVRAEIQKHVDSVNTRLASFESVKVFAIVPPMTIESGLLTASLKVKRKEVYARYAKQIEALYHQRD